MKTNSIVNGSGQSQVDRQDSGFDRRLIQVSYTQKTPQRPESGMDRKTIEERSSEISTEKVESCKELIDEILGELRRLEKSLEPETEKVASPELKTKKRQHRRLLGNFGVMLGGTGSREPKKVAVEKFSETEQKLLEKYQESEQQEFLKKFFAAQDPVSKEKVFNEFWTYKNVSFLIELAKEDKRIQGIFKERTGCEVNKLQTNLSRLVGCDVGIDEVVIKNITKKAEQFIQSFYGGKTELNPLDKVLLPKLMTLLDIVTTFKDSLLESWLDENHGEVKNAFQVLLCYENEDKKIGDISKSFMTICTSFAKKFKDASKIQDSRVDPQEIKDLCTKFESLKQALEDTEKIIKDLTTANETLKSQNAKLQTNLKHVEGLNQSLEREKGKLEREKGKLATENRELQRSLKKAEEEISSLKKARDELILKMDEYRTTYGNYAEKLRDLQKENNALDLKISKLEKTVKALNTKIENNKSAQKQLASKERECVELRAELDNLLKRYKDLEGNYEDVKADNDSFIRGNQLAHEKQKASEDEIEELNQEIEEICSKYSDLAKEARELYAENEGLRAENEELEKRLEESRAESRGYQDKIGSLKETNAALKGTNIDLNQQLTKIRDEKEKIEAARQKLEGERGRLEVENEELSCKSIEFQKQIDELQKELSSSSEKNKETIQEYRKAIEILSWHQKELSGQLDKNAKAKEQLETAERELIAKKEKCEEWETRCLDLEKQYKTLKEKYEISQEKGQQRDGEWGALVGKLDEEMTSIGNAYNSLSRQLQESKTAYNNLLKQLQDSISESQGLRASCNELVKENEKLRVEKEGLINQLDVTKQRNRVYKHQSQENAEKARSYADAFDEMLSNANEDLLDLIDEMEVLQETIGRASTWSELLDLIDQINENASKAENLGGIMKFFDQRKIRSKYLDNLKQNFREWEQIYKSLRQKYALDINTTWENLGLNDGDKQLLEKFSIKDSGILEKFFTKLSESKGPQQKAKAIFRFVASLDLKTFNDFSAKINPNDSKWDWATFCGERDIGVLCDIWQKISSEKPDADLNHFLSNLNCFYEKMQNESYKSIIGGNSGFWSNFLSTVGTCDPEQFRKNIETILSHPSLIAESSTRVLQALSQYPNFDLLQIDSRNIIDTIINYRVDQCRTRGSFPLNMNKQQFREDTAERIKFLLNLNPKPEVAATLQVQCSTVVEKLCDLPQKMFKSMVQILAQNSYNVGFATFCNNAAKAFSYINQFNIDDSEKVQILSELGKFIGTVNEQDCEAWLRGIVAIGADLNRVKLSRGQGDMTPQEFVEFFKNAVYSRLAFSHAAGVSQEDNVRFLSAYGLRSFDEYKTYADSFLIRRGCSVSGIYTLESSAARKPLPATQYNYLQLSALESKSKEISEKYNTSFGQGEVYNMIQIMKQAIINNTFPIIRVSADTEGMNASNVAEVLINKFLALNERQQTPVDFDAYFSILKGLDMVGYVDELAGKAFVLAQSHHGDDRFNRLILENSTGIVPKEFELFAGKCYEMNQYFSKFNLESSRDFQGNLIKNLKLVMKDPSFSSKSQMLFFLLSVFGGLTPEKFKCMVEFETWDQSGSFVLDFLNKQLANFSQSTGGLTSGSAVFSFDNFFMQLKFALDYAQTLNQPTLQQNLLKIEVECQQAILNTLGMSTSTLRELNTIETFLEKIDFSNGSYILQYLTESWNKLIEFSNGIVAIKSNSILSEKPGMQQMVGSFAKRVENAILKLLQKDGQILNMLNTTYGTDINSIRQEILGRFMHFLSLLSQPIPEGILSTLRTMPQYRLL